MKLQVHTLVVLGFLALGAMSRGSEFTTDVNTLATSEDTTREKEQPHLNPPVSANTSANPRLIRKVDFGVRDESAMGNAPLTSETGDMKQYTTEELLEARKKANAAYAKNKRAGEAGSIELGVEGYIDKETKMEEMLRKRHEEMVAANEGLFRGLTPAQLAAKNKEEMESSSATFGGKMRMRDYKRVIGAGPSDRFGNKSDEEDEGFTHETTRGDLLTMENEARRKVEEKQRMDAERTEHLRREIQQRKQKAEQLKKVAAERETLREARQEAIRAKKEELEKEKEAAAQKREAAKQVQKKGLSEPRNPVIRAETQSKKLQPVKMRDSAAQKIYDDSVPSNDEALSLEAELLALMPKKEQSVSSRRTTSAVRANKPVKSIVPKKLTPLSEEGNTDDDASTVVDGFEGALDITSGNPIATVTDF